MKTIKFLVAVSILSMVSVFSINAQKQEKIEVPRWCVDKATEYLKLFMADVKITPQDSSIISEEYALRFAKTSKMCKEATTEEEKVQISNDCYYDYNANLKKRLSPELYKKFVKWQIDRNAKK